MLKKILLTIVLFALVAIGFVGYGSYKVVNDTIKNKEPQIRQYIQLDEAMQNKYIIDNVSELLTDIDLDNDGKPEDKEKIKLLMKANDNPEVQQALINLGRSFMASVILSSDSILKDLNENLKDKYQQESEKLKANLEIYSSIVEKIEPALKK